MEIQGYPNYLIYQDGSIYSKNRGRLLKQSPNSHGYKQVALYKEGKVKKRLVHRLVAETYIPNPESKIQVDHIDRRVCNNSVSNLRWATQEENMANQGKRCDNTSGHKNIGWESTTSKWRYRKEIRGKMKQRYFKSKTNALCYKFGMLLKHQ